MTKKELFSTAYILGKEKKFRKSGKSFFLTYARYNLEKEKLLEELKKVCFNKNKKLTEYMVVKSKDEMDLTEKNVLFVVKDFSDYHLHVLLSIIN